MRLAGGKDDDVTRDQLHRRQIPKLDVALALGNHMKDHHPFGAGFQERCSRLGAG
jgi:hypothetical protein